MLTCSRHYFFLRIRVDHRLTKSLDKENFEYKCKNALQLTQKLTIAGQYQIHQYKKEKIKKEEK